MNSEEKQDLFFWIKDIQAEFGVTIVMIEHDMKMVMSLCERLVVLNFGKVIATGIDSEEDADICRDLGCHFGQGDFLGVPVPMSDLQEGDFRRD